MRICECGAEYRSKCRACSTRRAWASGAKKGWGRKPLLSQRGYNWLWVEAERKYRQEHILVAEKALGRRLKPGELVHHINGVKNDNRNSNLLICTQKYHAELHQRMSTAYMREHFGGAL